MTSLLLHDLNHFRSPITQGKYVEKCPCILPLWMFSSSSAYISVSSFHPSGSSPLWKRMHTDILREFMLMGSKNKKQKNNHNNKPDSAAALPVTLSITVPTQSCNLRTWGGDEK